MNRCHLLLVCISSNTKLTVIKESISLGLTHILVFQTPIENIIAIDAVATWLMCFPVCELGPNGTKHHRDILPDDIYILAIGGLNISNIGNYLMAGCNGIAIASALYKPRRTAVEVRVIAADLIAALKNIKVNG